MNNLPDITGILTNTFNALIKEAISFVPHLIGCLLIVLIGYFVASGISKLIQRILGSVGFDRIGDKFNEVSFIKQLKTEIRLSEIVSKVVYYFILLIFLTAATETLGINAITAMVLSLVNFMPKLIAGAVMLQVGILISDGIKSAVIATCKSFNIASSKLIGNIAFAFLLIISLITALGQIGIETKLLESSFLLVIGGAIFAFSLGYGIASKDVLSNIISSFYSRKNFREGQIIKIGDVKGVISKIDTTSITISNDHSVTIIPLHLLQISRVEILNFE